MSIENFIILLITDKGLIGDDGQLHLFGSNVTNHPTSSAVKIKPFFALVNQRQ